MKKKILIIGGFVAVFAVALAGIYMVKDRGVSKPVTNMKVEKIADDMHVFTIEGLAATCEKEDKIYCAIERVVKCTMTPELDGCNKDNVPSFVLGKTEEAVRPTKISFKIVKIKPQVEGNSVSVYTQSDCDATWFGLCKGTVIYSLSPKDNGDWAVDNIYAME